MMIMVTMIITMKYRNIKHIIKFGIIGYALYSAYKTCIIAVSE